ncbi:anti-sigma factor family protein [Streptomyces sp. NPDC002851]
MTSTTDTAEHPEVTELSELTEGLLAPSRATELRRHLAQCELCAEVHDSLAEIRELLGTLPGPPRMPADVAGRIDAALAAEALLDATAPEVQDTARETDARVSRETSTPAATDGPVDRPVGHARAATGPGRTPPGGRRRRRRIAAAALGAVATVAAIGFGALLIQPGGDKAADGGAHRTSVEAEGQVFSEAKLEGQVADLLGEKNRPEKAPAEDDASSKPSVSTESSPTSPRSHATLRGAAPQVPECITRGIDRDDPPLAAEKGDYQGKSAYLVVLPHGTDVSRVSAYVVDASCVRAEPPTKGEVLLTRSYARP